MVKIIFLFTGVYSMVWNSIIGEVDKIFSFFFLN